MEGEFLMQIYKYVHSFRSFLPEDWTPGDFRLDEFVRNTVVASNSVVIKSLVHGSNKWKPSGRNLKDIVRFQKEYLSERKISAVRRIPLDEEIGYLGSSMFKAWFTIIGGDRLMQLLNHCSFFERVDNHFFVQRTGKAISEYAYDRNFSLRPRKNKGARLFLTFNGHDDSEEDKKKSSSAEEAVISSQEVFYSKSKNFQELIQGLPNANDDHRPVHEIIFNCDDACQLDESKFLEQFELIKRNHVRCRFRNLLDKHCPVYLEKNFTLKSALEQSSSQKSVCAFLREVFYFVLPLELFGSQHNRVKVYQSLKLIIVSGNNCKFKTGNFLCGIKLEEVPWLHHFNTPTRRETAFKAFMNWLVKYFVTVLRTLFYVTETKKTKAQPIFYRHEMWDKMSDVTLQAMIKERRLVEMTSEEIETFEKSENVAIKISGLRFVPKSKSLRMLNRMPELMKDLKLTSDLQRLVLPLLRGFRKNIKIPVDDFSEMAHRVHQARLVRPDRKIYFIRADIADCYPSMDQKKVLKLLEEKVREFFGHESDPEFCVKEFRVVYVDKRRLFARPEFFGLKSDDFPVDVSELMNIDTSRYSNKVFEPRNRHTMKVSEAIKIIKNYVEDAVVKSGKKKFYRLRKGLRQGGALSGELSALYLEAFVERYFGQFVTSCRDSILINADDILFITSSVETARKALKTLIGGLDLEFGFKINLDKLQTNVTFDELPGPYAIVPCQEVGFSRHIYEIDSGRVLFNFNSFEKLDVRYSFAFSPFWNLSEICDTLTKRITISMTYVGLNENINSQLTVVKNLFESTWIQVARLSSFVRLSPKWCGQQNALAVVKFSNLISQRLTRVLKNWSRVKRIKSTLSQGEIAFICAAAVCKHWATFMSHRKYELEKMRELAKDLEQFVGKEKLILWKGSFAEYPKGPFKTMVPSHK